MKVIKKDGKEVLKTDNNKIVKVGPSESMSKSKKNTIDPEKIIANYGADQLDYLFYQTVHLKKMFNGLKKELFLHLNLFKNYGI